MYKDHNVKGSWVSRAEGWAMLLLAAGDVPAPLPEHRAPGQEGAGGPLGWATRHSQSRQSSFPVPLGPNTKTLGQAKQRGTICTVF